MMQEPQGGSTAQPYSITAENDCDKNRAKPIEVYSIEHQHQWEKPFPFEPANMATGGGGSWGEPWNS